jgi:hypothetical protein
MGFISTEDSIILFGLAYMISGGQGAVRPANSAPGILQSLESLLGIVSDQTRQGRCDRSYR